MGYFQIRDALSRAQDAWLCFIEEASGIPRKILKIQHQGPGPDTESHDQARTLRGRQVYACGRGGH